MTNHLKLIVFTIILSTTSFSNFAQRQSLNFVANLQEDMGLDSMVYYCKFFDFGDDCLAIFLPIFLESPIYSGYALTKQNEFVDFYIRYILNSDFSHITQDDYVEACNAFGNCVLQKDTLLISSYISSDYIANTLFQYYFIRSYYDCTLVSDTNLHNRKLIRKLFSHDRIFKQTSYENWVQNVCELFKYGYITFASWCATNMMDIRLIDPYALKEVVNDTEY